MDYSIEACIYDLVDQYIIKSSKKGCIIFPFGRIGKITYEITSNLHIESLVIDHNEKSNNVMIYDDISVIMDAINIVYTDDDEIIGLAVKLDY